MPHSYDSLTDEMRNAEEDITAMELEINQEIPIDDPTQVVLHKEMFIDITST